VTLNDVADPDGYICINELAVFGTVLPPILTTAAASGQPIDVTGATVTAVDWPVYAITLRLNDVVDLAKQDIEIVETSEGKPVPFWYVTADGLSLWRHAVDYNWSGGSYPISSDSVFGQFHADAKDGIEAPNSATVDVRYDFYAGSTGGDQTRFYRDTGEIYLLMPNDGTVANQHWRNENCWTGIGVVSVQTNDYWKYTFDVPYNGEAVLRMLAASNANHVFPVYDGTTWTPVTQLPVANTEPISTAPWHRNFAINQSPRWSPARTPIA
jgi:hypothetical protein